MNRISTYTVEKYNENIFNVFVEQFNVITINIADEHDLDIDIAADGDGSVSARKFHNAVAPLIQKLNGEWFLGEARQYDYNGNLRIVRNVTRSNINEAGFIAEKKLTAINGKIEIVKL